jgi:hypothetical protein
VRRELAELKLELGKQRVDVGVVPPLLPHHRHEVAVPAAVRAEGQVDVEVANAGHAALRGRGTSSPAQFGQTCAIAFAHSTQNVHSYEQIVAGPSGPSAIPHRSHAGRISKLISSPGRG